MVMMNEETKMLYDKLYVFLKEAIPILRKSVSTSLLPTFRRYGIKKDKNRVKIVVYNSPNWWQIQDYGKISKLPSLNEAIGVCNKHQQIRTLDGKWSYALGHGTSFHANHVPISFLKELVNCENGLRFRKKSFEKIFNNFLRYISLKEKSYARLIVPLHSLAISTNVINLEQNLRIRNLTNQELVDILNNCPTIAHFYGAGLSAWFRCILEFDMPFNWSWVMQSEKDDKNHFFAIKNSTEVYQSLKPNINQEIVMLRAILNRQISSSTYVIDYRGWESVMFSGGQINYLPWIRSKIFFTDPLLPKEINNYKKYRRKFLTMNERKTQQRIFVAMRKLAFSMEKPYGGDEMMDTVSGLEGLLVNSRNEIRHKFAERVALLLEKDPQKREELQKDMRKAYDLRSDVAHGLVVTDDVDSIMSKVHVGQKPQKKEIDEFNKIQELRKRTRQLLHQAILVCLDKQTTNFSWDSSLMGTKISPL